MFKFIIIPLLWLAGGVGFLSITSLAVFLYGLTVGYIAQEYIIEEKGPLVDEQGLPDPLYPQRESIPLFAQPGGKVVGTLERSVVYPAQKSQEWVSGFIYFWAWDADYTDGLGDAFVVAEATDLHNTGDGIVVGRINQGTRVEKRYLNKEGSWALCTIQVAVRANDVSIARRSLGGWETFLGDKYPVITWTTRESGEAGTKSEVKTLYDNGWVIVLTSAMVIFVLLSWIRSRSTVTKNKITVSKVSGSSVNIQSPFAAAVIELDKKGESASARALLTLVEILESSELKDSDKENLKELLAAIAEEARRPQRRKATLKALGVQLASQIAVSAIAKEATPLVDEISQLWQ